MNHLSGLLTELRSAWEQICGGDLHLVREPDLHQSSATVSAPIAHEGVTYAWLEASPPAGKHELTRPLLQSWADLLGAIMGERETSEGLTNELIAAWNRLSFLHQVTQLRRTTTDPWQVSLESLRLAAQTIEAENAFVAQLLERALVYDWVHPAYSEGETRRILAVLQSADGMLVRNGEQACSETFPELAGLYSFIGQRLQVTASPLSFMGIINQTSRQRFSAGDLQLFESLAETIATVIDVEALHIQRIEAEKQNRDLELAAEVQAAFLPAEPPSLPGYELAATVIPASKIGGDLYDVFQCEGGHTGLLVCDVAGKGISAALLAASVRATIRAELQHASNPGEVLQSANAKLYGDMSRNERFVTALLVCLPASRSCLQYASAGHTTGLWVQTGPLHVQKLPSTTLPLGILPEIESATAPIDVQPGDVVVVYSDGLSEAENEQGRILGMAGITDLLLATHSAPARFILDSLTEAYRQHIGLATVVDDLTLLVLKRVAGDAPGAGFLARLHWPSDLSVLPDVRAQLERLKPHLCGDRDTRTWLMEVELAATEVVTNIITHAYAHRAGNIHGLVALYPDRLQIDLFDIGDPYEPGETRPLDFDPTDPPESGYGLHIIQQVMDAVSYERLSDGHNHWQLVREVPQLCIKASITTNTGVDLDL